MNAPEPATRQPDRTWYATLARRTAIAAAVTIILAIPSVVLYLFLHQPAVTWSIVGGIVGLLAVLTGGRELGFLATGILVALTPVAIVAGSVPIAAAGLMAIMSLMLGRSARFGLHRVLLVIPIFMTWMLMEPPFWNPGEVVDRTNPDYLMWMAIIFAVGSAFPVIVMPLVMKKVQILPTQPHDRADTITYTWTITILTTVAIFVLLEYFPQTSGAWLISTILVLTQVGEVGTVRLTVHRTVGTLIGVAVVAILVSIGLPLPVLYVIGLITMIAALDVRFGPHYWLYTALITPTVVLLNSSSSTQISGLADQRAAFTVIGALLVVLSAGIAVGYAHWENKHGNGPTQETPSATA